MITLHLLGGATVVGEGGPLTGRAFQKRRLALLALLGAAPKGTVSRDKLMAYLWPESDTEHARHLLAVSVYELRKALGEDALISAGDDLRLNPEAVRPDLGEFQQALVCGDLERVAAVYAGPFLDGFHLGEAREFERWMTAERERLAGLYAGALERLAAERRERGNRQGEVEAWRRLAAHAPYNSRYALGLMHALIDGGDRVGAIQHACAHAARLHADYGLQPEAGILSLVARLQREPSG